MNRQNCTLISNAVAEKDIPGAIAAIDTILLTETGAHWVRDLTKLKAFLADGAPRFSIFAKDGNGKLPFLAFSSLPGKGFCVGAGDCLSFCYSFKAWRYPAAFCRQVQNSILLQTKAGKRHILSALDQFKPKAGAIDFRLYVDGDFTGVADIQFWMEALTARPWLLTYGYSKSWQSFLDYKGIVPSNYKLNLSSGSKYDDSVKDKLKAFDYVRGEFIAVSVGHKVATQDHAKRDHQATLRQVYAKKAYTCTGKCGDCTPVGHACGSDRFKGIDIIIAVH
jgi:hypothetical protein